jgi:hypothetical protein
MPDKTPAEKAVDKETARHQAKLKNAPAGSRLAANLIFRIARGKATLLSGSARTDAEATATSAQIDAIGVIEAAEAKAEAEAKAAAAAAAAG